MSQFSANTLMPLFSALPEEQQRVFLEKAGKLVSSRNKPKPKRKTTRDRVADQLGEEFREGNEEMLLASIINGN